MYKLVSAGDIAAGFRGIAEASCDLAPPIEEGALADTAAFESRLQGISSSASGRVSQQASDTHEGDGHSFDVPS